MPNEDDLLWDDDEADEPELEEPEPEGHPVPERAPATEPDAARAAAPHRPRRPSPTIHVRAGGGSLNRRPVKPRRTPSLRTRSAKRKST